MSSTTQNSNKTILIIVGVIVGLLVLIGAGFGIFWLLNGSSELTTEEQQNSFIEESVSNFENAEEFEITGKTEENGQTANIVIKATGENYQTEVDQDDISIKVIQMGSDVYLGSGDEWLKVSDDIADQMAAGAEEAREELVDILTGFDDEEMQYEGLEEIDGVQAQKFLQTGEEGGYVWFDAKTKLPIRLEDDATKVTIVYDTSVEAPSEFEDISSLSDIEQSQKIAELFF